MCSQDGSLLPLVSLACYLPWDIRAEILTSSRVGGIISETSFKFFIQFVAYASIYCLHVLVFMAIFVAEVRSQVSGAPNILSHILGLWRRQVYDVKHRYSFPLTANSLYLLLWK